MEIRLNGKMQKQEQRPRRPKAETSVQGMYWTQWAVLWAISPEERRLTWSAHGQRVCRLVSFHICGTHGLASFASVADLSFPSLYFFDPASILSFFQRFISPSPPSTWSLSLYSSTPNPFSRSVHPLLTSSFVVLLERADSLGSLLYAHSCASQFLKTLQQWVDCEAVNPLWTVSWLMNRPRRHLVETLKSWRKPLAAILWLIQHECRET